MIADFALIALTVIALIHSFIIGWLLHLRIREYGAERRRYYGPGGS